MALTHPLQWFELSCAALRKNVDAIARLAGRDRQVAVCVKANAYGHGLSEIVALLCDCKRVDYVTVHSLDEAIACRNAGWQKRLMLLGPVATRQIALLSELDVEPLIFDRETLAAVGKLSDKIKRPIRTHLKLETGTGRQGISTRELPTFAALYKKYRYLRRPYGAAMHFANIEDTTSHEYAEEQLRRFQQMLAKLEKLGIKPQIRHTASSAALILFDKTRLELVRPGLAMYGHWPSKETYLSYRMEGGKNDLFHSVLSWKTRITQLKQLPGDSFIGYGCTYKTNSATKIAILPIGYADGYPRSLSNQGHVLIHGKRASVRGRICMNLTIVDVSEIKRVRLGDEVTIIGTDGNEKITAEMLADWGGTINYEILARLSPLVVRKVVF